MDDQTSKWREILEQTERIAVIGMKDSGAAFGVPAYMERQGYVIVPVNPLYDEIGGRIAYASVDELDEPVDMVNIFRRPQAVAGHVDEILRMDPHPSSVWLQVGIRHNESAERLREAGIEVVQDLCLKVVHARLFS